MGRAADGGSAVRLSDEPGHANDPGVLAKCAARAGIDDVHPHLLRHGTGFHVNKGVDSLTLAAYLGHKNVNNTRRYARMNATRFDGLWRD